MLINPTSSVRVRLDCLTNTQGLPSPARYTAFAASPDSHALISILAPRRCTMNSSTHTEYAAFVGIDWADRNHDVCLQPAGCHQREFSVLPHRPESCTVGADTTTALRGPPHCDLPRTCQGAAGSRAAAVRLPRAVSRQAPHGVAPDVAPAQSYLHPCGSQGVAIAVDRRRTRRSVQRRLHAADYASLIRPRRAFPSSQSWPMYPAA